MGRRKKLPLLEKVEITDFAAEGKALARVNDMVVFAPYLAPGDIADIQVIKKRKKYMKGSYTKIHSLSNLRVEPVCSHFGVCGGCKWQHLDYEKQLFYKEKQVSETLSKIGKVELPEVLPIKGAANQTFYRNKNEYTFSASRWLTDEEIKSGADFSNRNALGFHIPGRFDRVLDIDQCYLQDNKAYEIRKLIRQYSEENNLSYYDHKEHKGLLRNLIIRNTSINEWMVILSAGEDNKPEIENCLKVINDKFPELTSLLYVINTKLNSTINDLEIHCYAGRDFIYEEMDDVRFKIGAKSFFQTNSEQAKILYRKTKEFANLTSNDTVYDLYTGTGTIANYIAKDVNKVVGIEYVPEAIEDAKINSKLNSNNNTVFYAGDMKDLFKSELFAEHGKPDVVITDPPRAGMHADVVASLLDAKPRRIVYVSCNPATQARDIALLDSSYKVTKVQPVDMFPHTHHVENIAVLEQR